MWLEYVSNIVPFIAAIIAAVAAVWGIQQTNKRWSEEVQLKITEKIEERDLEKKSMAAALCGEITSLFELIEARNYIQDLEKHIGDEDYNYYVPLRDRELMPTYHSYIGKTGILGP